MLIIISIKASEQAQMNIAACKLKQNTSSSHISLAPEGYNANPTGEYR